MATAAAPRTNGANGNGGSPEKPPADVTKQLSFGGAPRSGFGIGYATPDDYTRDMQDPQRRMEIFEEMGASDAPISTAIGQRVTEVSASDWTLASEDDSERGLEILDFCEDNTYPHLEDLLRWLVEPVQFGFTALEPVYEWSDQPFVASITRRSVARPTRPASGRMLYLRKIAHIRQPTVVAFKITPEGELDAVVQYAYDGRTFEQKEIPAGKLILRVRHRRGDDYFGVPVLRSLHRTWSYKRDLEARILLHFDKFAVGIPVLTEPEGGLTAAERTIAYDWLRRLRSGTENAATVPFGCKLEIITADGSLAAASLAREQFYGQNIQKRFATQLSELGTTQTGSRAVGESFDAQLGTTAQADIEDIANLLNNELIVKLVKWNFGPQETYPTFNPSRKEKAGSGKAADVKVYIDAGIVHPRPEDEVAARDQLGMAEVSLEDLKLEAEQRSAKADAIAAQKAAQPTNAPPGDPSGAPNPDRQPASPARRAATRLRADDERSAATAVLALAQVIADGGPTPANPGTTTHRTTEFTTWEQEVLRPDVLMRDLDLQTARLTGEVQDVLSEIDGWLSAEAERYAGEGAQALAESVKSLAVPDRLRRKLRTVLLDAAYRSRAYGSTAVRSEVVRQLGPGGVGSGVGPQRDNSVGPPFHAPWANMGPMDGYSRAFAARMGRRAMAVLRTILFANGDEEKTPEQLHLEAAVNSAVEDEISRRESAARGAIINAIAQGAKLAAAAFLGIVKAGLASALVGLSTNRTESNVGQVVNVAFGIGRTEEAQAINAAVVAPAVATSPAPSSTRPSSGGGASPASDATPTPSGGGRRGRSESRSGLLDAEGNPIELVSKVYSAVMDMGTCDECAKWDGAVFPMEYPEDFTGVQCPNPRCAGGYGRCRCAWVYVIAGEQSGVPASKGPVPVERPTPTPFTREQLTEAITLAVEPNLTELRTALAASAAKSDTAPQPITLHVHIDPAKPAATTKVLTTPKGEYRLTTEPAESGA